MKIYIDPRARISYASWYIFGLYHLYGKKQVVFSMKYFSELSQNEGVDDFDHYFAFVLVENGKAFKKVVIDYRDKNTINVNALRWCNIYGKVNYNSQTVEITSLSKNEKERIVPVGPNFGIKIWGVSETFNNFFINYFKGIGYHPVSIRNFASGYNWQMKRMPYEFYSQTISESKYVFFVSSLYKESNNFHISTNYWRAAYIRACKKLSINFEGGLLASDNHPNRENYLDVLTNQYIKPNQYLQKLKKSSIVFNTPAVWGCHGWKLGEFLSMGKAIISTPFLNEMPYPMENGQNIHYVESELEIQNGVEKILSDQVYRQKLENGARTYFEKYLAPEIVVKRLIDNVK